MKNVLPLLAIGMLLPATLSATDAEGIFADVETTLGSFSAELDPTTAPLTVANFIRLAEGSGSWLDAKTGALQTDKPFYNGLIFHRVIKGFMSQGGCPLGNGTSGPGYEFRDEVTGGLPHDGPYRLSMANSGFNTNGSQFFITAAATPWLDGKHTVFGTVTSGLTVVDAINSVETDPDNDRPLTPVVIQNISIRRVGEAALAFDAHAQGLPVCLASKGRLEVEPGVSCVWNFDPPMAAGDLLRAFRSANLKDWTFMGEAYADPAGEPIKELTLDEAKAPRAFFQLPVIRHSGLIGSSDTAGRTVALRVNDDQVMTFRFGATGEDGVGDLATTGKDTESFTFTLFDAWALPLSIGWIFNTSEYGYLRVEAQMDSETDSQISGRRNLLQWNGAYWNQINDSHGFTLTK